MKKIENLPSNKLELKVPFLAIRTEKDPSGVWIAHSWSHNFTCYGEGETERGAIKDYCVVLEEKYFSYKKDKDNLGSALKKELQYLKSVVKEI